MVLVPLHSLFQSFYQKILLFFLLRKYPRHTYSSNNFFLTQTTRLSKSFQLKKKKSVGYRTKKVRKIVFFMYGITLQIDFRCLSHFFLKIFSYTPSKSDNAKNFYSERCLAHWFFSSAAFGGPLLPSYPRIPPSDLKIPLFFSGAFGARKDPGNRVFRTCSFIKNKKYFVKILFSIFTICLKKKINFPFLIVEILQ